MKKQRSIRELLIILRDNEKLFIDQECTGLCYLIRLFEYKNEITLTESTKINTFIREKCKRNKRYYYQNDSHYPPFYFPMYKWTPRKAWLDRWIKKLNK